MRAVISLGDVLRAMQDLGPLDAAAREDVLRMMGQTHALVVAAPPAIGVWKSSSTETVGRERARPVTVPEPPAASVAPVTRPSQPRGERASRAIVAQVRDAPGHPSPPAWLSVTGDPLAPAPVDAVVAVTPEPLFGGRTGRAILTAVLATHVAQGDLDLDLIVDVLGQGRPLSVVPRRATPTLRRGVQVLIDAAAGMDPYRADAEHLLTRLDAVVSDGRLEVGRFLGCPSRGVVTGARDETMEWTAPPAGTPVLLLTELGIGGPLLDDDRASVAEWLRFARTVRAAGCTIVGLVPYEARRWPPLLARMMTLVHWSERTTVGEVRRAVREAYRGRR